MSAQPDEFDAARSVVAATSSFKPEEQLRILRWAAEILGIPLTSRPSIAPVTPAALGSPGPVPAPAPISHVDLRSFIQAKKPKTDVQFSAAVAYYFRFEAAPESRKEFITANDLQSATRLAEWRRFQNPKVPLNNARSQGYLDTGPEKASFAINPVGENLVAMVLPNGEAGNGQPLSSSPKAHKRGGRPADQARSSKRKV